MTVIACTKCNVEKPPADFHKNRAAPGGLRLECKPCRRLISIAAYLADPDASKRRATEWAKANPDRVKERLARHNEKHREKRRALSREWQKANRPKGAEFAARRRAICARATPSWADKTLIRDIYELASIYRKFGYDIHVDHIIPLNSPIVCGLHVHENLQLLPAAKNVAKKNRLIQTDGGGLSL